jgi:putative ABC transport system substrate-binding protein
MTRHAIIVTTIIFVVVWLLAGPSVVTAQQETRPARIGILVVAERAKPVAAFREALKELGYVEGRNLIVRYRSAGGNTKRLPSLARELVASNVDIIVTHSTPGIRSVKNATSTIPIVMASVGNAVQRGFVESVARPGGNVTGNSFFGAELAAKRVGVLKEALPSIARMALLAHPSYPKAARLRAQKAVKSLGMNVQLYFAEGPAAFDHAFAAMKQQRAEAVQVLASPVFHGNRGLLIKAAARYGIPAIYPWRNATERGGLMSYGHDLVALFRRAAVFVDRILKGADPADLPVERPTKFELAVNLKTAKALGITFPPSILLRADKVIE